jgi:hypothetical protein
MVESAKNSGYLVGPTVGGSFGSHHFNQFYPILKLKEMYNEQKAEGEALKGDGFSNAVGGVLSVTTGGLINAKQASKFLHDNGDVIDTIVTVAAVIAAPFTGGATLLALAAYKGVKGAYEGGVLGAVTGAVSAYSSVTGVDVSYSYDEGFGANVGVEVGAFSAGASYTERGGFGVNASMEVAGVFSVGASYSQNEGFGASLGVSVGGGPDGRGTSFNAGISYTQKGGVGGNVGASNSGGAGRGVTTAGQMTYSEQKGFGVNVSASYKDPSKSANAKNTPNSSKPVSAQRPNNMNGSGASLGYSQKEGFEASVDIAGANAFNWSEVGGLTGNTNYMVDKYRADQREEIEQEKEKKEKLIAEGEENFVNKWKEKNPKDKDLTNSEIFAKYAAKKRADGAEKDGSRTNIADHALGFVEDNFLNYGGSNSQTYVDEEGKFHVRTCFVAGTKVHTQDGLKNIEEIRVGDVVLSKSDVTGEVSYRQVVNTFIRQADAIYKVTFTDGTTLETTWSHPFRVLKSDAKDKEFNIENTQWTQAKDLVSGDVALSADGAKLQIVSIEIDDRAETVYNFEVEDFHTYFVGEVGVWVHNADVGYKKNILDSSSGQYTGKTKVLGGKQYFGVNIGGKEYAERIRPDGTKEYVFIQKIKGDDSSDYYNEHSYSSNSNGIAEENMYIWKGKGRNGKTGGEYWSTNSDSIIYHSTTSYNSDGSIKERKLNGKNGLFTSGFDNGNKDRNMFGKFKTDAYSVTATDVTGNPNAKKYSVTRNAKGHITNGYYMGDYTRYSNGTNPNNPVRDNQYAIQNTQETDIAPFDYGEDRGVSPVNGSARQNDFAHDAPTEFERTIGRFANSADHNRATNPIHVDTHNGSDLQSNDDLSSRDQFAMKSGFVTGMTEITNDLYVQFLIYLDINICTIQVIQILFSQDRK